MNSSTRDDGCLSAVGITAFHPSKQARPGQAKHRPAALPETLRYHVLVVRKIPVAGASPLPAVDCPNLPSKAKVKPTPFTICLYCVEQDCSEDKLLLG